MDRRRVTVLVLLVLVVLAAGAMRIRVLFRDAAGIDAKLVCSGVFVSGRSAADVQKAIGAFRKAVEINPKYAQAYKELAFALLNVGDRPGARAALQNYVEVAPEAPDAAQMKQIIKTLPEA